MSAVARALRWLADRIDPADRITCRIYRDGVLVSEASRRAKPEPLGRLLDLEAEVTYRPPPIRHCRSCFTTHDDGRPECCGTRTHTTEEMERLER